MRIEESPPILKLIEENKKAWFFDPGAFCNTMFSDTASKVEAMVVRCFV